MCKRFLILFTVLMSWGISSCQWRDDFRAREQPQYFEPPPRPTLNRESLDYVGDDTHKTEQLEKGTSLPNIDALSAIPEVPDHPVSVPAHSKPILDRF